MSINGNDVKNGNRKLEVLDRVNTPQDLKRLNVQELDKLAEEIRYFLIDSVSKTGGHLAPNLGVVELTIALDYVFDSPKDKFVFDVGHQCYVHKILTGRKDKMNTLRQMGGLSGFPKRDESEHDSFGTGHASTSISAALGMAKARDIMKKDYKVVAIIGDGAMTGGIALEALNHGGHLQTDFTIILNDNQMSIAPNVGAMCAYTNRLAKRTDQFPLYNQVRKDVHYLMDNVPKDDAKMQEALKRLRESALQVLTSRIIFEELGYTYLGPVDGHNISHLINVLQGAKEIKGPVILHVITKKGKGYEIAEDDASKFHGIAPFDPETGKVIKKGDKPTYTEIFGSTLCKLAEEDKEIVAITAAMPSGTGLMKFAETFPERFFDVGIAEQHAVTFAGGLATQGLKPVFAVYSTFLQRAYDEVLHDVCLQKLNVMFALDRAGIVGDDGATHQGVFDFSYLRNIPNLVICAPKDENEFQHLMKTCMEHEGPTAIRYPRGSGTGAKMDEKMRALGIGRGEIVREGKDVLIIAIGSRVQPSLDAAEILKAKGIEATVLNARFLKPLDEKLISKEIGMHSKIITVEDNVVAGGFGSAVLEMLEEEGCCKNLESKKIKLLGFPDEFIEHGTQAQLFEKYGLDAKGIAKTVEAL